MVGNLNQWEYVYLLFGCSLQLPSTPFTVLKFFSPSPKVSSKVCNGNGRARPNGARLADLCVELSS